jgi:hypothetical protein
MYDLVKDYLNKVSKIWFDHYDFNNDANYVKNNIFELDDDLFGLASDKFEEEFLFDLFNSWKNPKFEEYNFHSFCESRNRYYYNDVSSDEFYRYLRKYAIYCEKNDIEFDITTYDHETIWNKLGFWFAFNNVWITEKFHKEYIQKLKEKIEEGREFKTECVLCYEKKQIEGYCISCKDKCFCYDCWNKISISNDPCPFCRQLITISARRYSIMDYNIIDVRLEKNIYKLNWFNNMKKVINEIKSN